MANDQSLDLRRVGELSVEDASLIDMIEPDVRCHYNDYIGKLIKANNLTKFGLLLSVTCRNTIVSPVLDTLCRAVLLEKKIKRGEIPKVIIVDDKETAIIARQILINNSCDKKVSIKVDIHKYVISHIILNVFKSVYRLVINWFWSRFFRLKKRPKNEILYVDNFLFLNNFQKGGEFFDRYYTGHEKYLNPDEIQKEWFAPALVGITNPIHYIKLAIRIKKCNRNFLLQEAWLTLFDYIYSFVFSIYVPYWIRVFPLFSDYDISDLLLREIKRDIASPALMNAINRYRFIRRLSKEKVQICGVVDWNENQVIDRAMNLGFKKFYPNLVVHGYQGFAIFEQYASLQPTCYEKELGTLPDLFHVVDKRYSNNGLFLCDSLEYKISPAFRFAYLFSIKDRRPDGLPIILIALPMIISESKRIIRACLSLAENIHGQARFLIKHHPSYTNKQFEKHVPEYLSPAFERTSEKLPDLLEVGSLIISSASSVCLEAIAVGIPVAIHGNRSGVTMNPLNKNIPQNLWSVFYTHEQLEAFVMKALVRKERKSIVNELFRPIDRDGTRELFTCPQRGLMVK